MTAASVKLAVYPWREFVELDDAAENSEVARSHLMTCRPKTERYR